MTDPLSGARIVVPVTAGRRELADRLRALGAHVTEREFIEIEPAEDPDALRAAAQRWCDGDYDWLVVTSRNALNALAAAANDAGRTLDEPMPTRQLAVVGDATARAAAELGLGAALRPSGQQSAAGLVTEFPTAPSTGARSGVPASGARVLTPVGNLAGDVLTRGLTRKGWTVDAVEAYRTVDGPGLGAEDVEAVAAGGLDAVVLTSGSVARRFAAQCHRVAPGLRLVAIGTTTASAVREAGCEVASVAATPDYEGVVDALRRAMEGERE